MTEYNMTLPKEFKEKWINALVSGKYQQITDNLCDEYGFCAIGVALVAAGNVPINKIENVPNIDENLIKGYNLPFVSTSDEILDWAIELNDNEGYTFHEIADFIENNVDGIDNE
jgi:hypothetical protein|tara:strand:- start:12737 stop:13078 length:342 start_codon:yes stop_codon:yes gene_type:complete